MAESKVKRENFITVQGWMLTDLKLKGNELIIYACIYGFSQAENQVFNGSLQYLADWTNSTKRSVMNCLKSLEEKGFIGKKENYINGVKFCEYHATKFTGGMEKSSLGDETKFNRGIEQSSPNNISFNNKADNKEDKERKKEEPNGYDAIISQSSFNDEVKETIIEFVKMRKLIKKPMTDFALKKLLNKLSKISSNPQVQISVLEKSILNNWQDIYEPKEDEKPKEEPAKPIKRTIYDIV
jgi:hypothetical protein